MMKSFSKIALLMTVFGLLSCNKQIVGVYDRKENRIGPDIFRLKLNSNMTFDYYGWSDVLGGDTIKGKWSLANDTLRLVKDDLSRKDLIWLKEKRIDKNETEILVFDASDGAFLIGANVYLNNSSIPLIVGPNGAVEVNSEIVIRKIAINYLTYTDSVFTSDVKAKRLEVYLDIKNRKQEKFFVNEKWLFMGSRLLPIVDGYARQEGAYQRR